MPESNRERVRRRNREQLAKQLNDPRHQKIRQIQEMTEKLDRLPINAFTGQVEWPKPEAE